MTGHHTDIVTTGWVARMPDAIKPYIFIMRLDRPIGSWLLFWPAAWAILLASPSIEWMALCLFGLGAIIMRGAGCVINDLWDRDLDKQVTRTERRPIAAGTMTVKQALIFLALLLSIGLLILLQFNTITIILGCVSLAFVASYPLMKRITWWPQAFLGLTFNFGALMGWAAVSGELGWQAWFLYTAGFFWTMGYDTIYAVQDLEDDALAGIKSTARLFGDQIHKMVATFYGVHLLIMGVVLYISFFVLQDTGIITTLIAALGITFMAVHLIWQVKTLDTNDPKNALRRMQSNRDYGFILCALLLITS